MTTANIAKFTKKKSAGIVAVVDLVEVPVEASRGSRTWCNPAKRYAEGEVGTQDRERGEDAESVEDCTASEQVVLLLRLLLRQIRAVLSQSLKPGLSALALLFLLTTWPRLQAS